MVAELTRNNIYELFKDTFGDYPSEVRRLPISGSSRLYFRLVDAHRSVIAAYNEDLRENQAFIYFSEHFKKYDLPVPQIFAERLDQHIYLQEDLGDQMLFDFIKLNSWEIIETIEKLKNKFIKLKK